MEEKLGKKTSAPAAPDPAATAAAQAAANKEAVRESALVNQINQVSPYGNVNYTGAIGESDPTTGAPLRTQTLTLPPEVQAILSGQQGIAGQLTDFAGQFAPRVAEGLATPFSTENLGVNRPQITGDTRNQVAEALLGRLEPQFARDEAAMQNRLANQGINVGSEAYGAASDDFSRARNDARLAAQAQAGAEESRQYGLESNAYQQAISDALLNRTQGLNEVSALVQGAPAINMPNAPSPAQYQVNPADITGANALGYQGAWNNYKAQQDRQNAQMGGLFQLGAAAIPLLSDRRVKTDVKRIGATDGGLPVYTFRYIGSPVTQMGVMADEVETVIPEAVVEIGGVLHVDYARIV
jgi:hypothetical protein